MKIFVLILLILSLFLTGCWDRRELNELAITMAMGIDKVEDEYQLTAQVVVPTEISMQGSTGRSSVTLFQSSGATVYEAFRKMTKDTPRKIYPGHLRILVLGEDLAKEGIGESLELLSRDWELRSDFYVVIARDLTAAEVLNVTTTLETIPANKMFGALQTSEDAWAATASITIDDLIADLTSEGKDAVITGIMVIGNKEIGTSKQNVESITPSARLQYDEIAVFKKDALVGWLTDRESRGFNKITNQVKTTVATISCPEEGNASIEVIKFNTKVKGKVVNGTPEIDLNMQIGANIGAVECKIDLTKTETFAELEKIYEKELTEVLEETIEFAQNQSVDIFGFGDAIHRSNPKEWKNLKDHWDEEFSVMKVNIKVDSNFKRMGTVDKTFLEKIKD